MRTIVLLTLVMILAVLLVAMILAPAQASINWSQCGRSGWSYGAHKWKRLGQTWMDGKIVQVYRHTVYGRTLHRDFCVA